MGPAPASQQLLELAATGQPRPAIDFALGLLAAGHTVESLITEVLAPTQQQVGVLWELNEWSTAQEHAATAVVDGILGAVGLQTVAPMTPHGRVLVACVEEEYHTLPARMGTERLRAAGWDVTFLGGSLPAEDLQRFAALSEPDIVVLSCTVPLFLPGAARCIAAITDLGLPAVAAGGGFGSTPARAARIGASGWIGTEAHASLLAVNPGPAGPVLETHPAAVALEVQGEELSSACIAEMSVRIPQMSAYSPRQLAHTRADLGYILRYLALAIDMDERPIFDTFISWLSRVLNSRQVPASTLDRSLEILADVLERAEFQVAAEICSSGCHAVPEA